MTEFGEFVRCSCFGFWEAASPGLGSRDWWGARGQIVVLATFSARAQAKPWLLSPACTAYWVASAQIPQASQRNQGHGAYSRGSRRHLRRTSRQKMQIDLGFETIDRDATPVGDGLQRCEKSPGLFERGIRVRKNNRYGGFPRVNRGYRPGLKLYLPSRLGSLSCSLRSNIVAISKAIFSPWQSLRPGWE